MTQTAAKDRRKELNRSVVVRMDDTLYEAIERDAHENERTVSQSIRHKLRELSTV